MKFSFLIIVILHFNLLLTAQTFQNRGLTEQEEKNGVKAVFINTAFEYSAKLTLFKNATFTYEENATNHIFSGGKWINKNDVIVLNSEIDSNEVFVKLLYFDSDTVRTYYEEAQNSQMNAPLYRTKFQVPINLKGSPFPDSRIFVNNDSSYCFPFFDTCVGEVSSFNKIKIDFGDGFKTKWIMLNNRHFKRLLIVAQYSFLFNDYLAFRNYKLKIDGNRLLKID